MATVIIGKSRAGAEIGNPPERTKDLSTRQSMRSSEAAEISSVATKTDLRATARRVSVS